MKCCLVGLMGVVLLISSAPVDAGIVVTTDATKPSTDVLVSYHVSATNFAYSWNWEGTDLYDHNELGQSFLISESSDVLLDKITLWARNVSASVEGQDYTLEIWNLSTSSDWNGDVLVSSQSDTLPSSGLTVENQYWTFDIEDVRLANGEYYGFLLAFDNGPSSGLRVPFVGAYVDGFSDGRLISRRGTPPAWSTSFSDKDLDFALQGDAIPDPTTFVIWSLLGCFGMAVCRYRRPKA